MHHLPGVPHIPNAEAFLYLRNRVVLRPSKCTVTSFFFACLFTRLLLPLSRTYSRLLLGLLLACAGAEQAAQAQVYDLDLGKQVLSLSERAMYIEQVLNGRAKRTGIGTVHRGVDNALQQADPRPNVPQALPTGVQAQIPQRPTDHPIVLVVRQLALTEEITAFSEKASQFHAGYGDGRRVAVQRN